MRKTLFITIVTLLVAVALAAQPAPPDGPNGMRGPAVLAKYLQLTQDQITAWQQIQKDTEAAVQPLAANAQDLQKQLEAALSAATPDAAAVGKLAISLHGVRQQIRAAHDAAKAKRLAVLTADQKAKLDAFEAARAFMHPRGAGRPGPRAGAMMGR